MKGCRSYNKKDLTMVDYLLTRTRSLLKGDFEVTSYRKQGKGFTEEDYQAISNQTIRTRHSTEMAKDTISQAIDEVLKTGDGYGILAHIDRKDMVLSLYHCGISQDRDWVHLINRGYFKTPFNNLYIRETL